MPWIHLQDEVGAILHVLHHPVVSGPVNLVAPGIVRNAEWTRQLASHLSRPAFFHAPGFALKAVLGGFGATLLASYRVAPGRLRETGYPFEFGDLPAALADLVRDRS